jgi:maltose alpha-D-glucosyltransferase/alpha-amylase
MRTSTHVRRQPKKNRGGGLSAERDWEEILVGDASASLCGALQQWLPSRRWFRSKTRIVESVRIQEQIPVAIKPQKAVLLLFEVNFTEGDPESYVIPLASAFGQKAKEMCRDWPQMILAEVSLNRPRRTGILYDAIVSKDFCHSLLVLIAHRQKVVGQIGDLEAEPTGVLRRIQREKGLNMEPSVSKAEQSNSSVIYGGSVILKFFRRLDVGVNPELEIERFLAARQFPHAPALAGALEYHDCVGSNSTMAVLTSFIPGCHDAWEDTLSALTRFYEKVQKLSPGLGQAPSTSGIFGSIMAEGKSSKNPRELIGSYLQDAQTLGKRTAALHLTLASDRMDPAFCPEPLTAEAKQSLSESLQKLTRHNFELLRNRLVTLGPDSRELARQVLSFEKLITERFKNIANLPVHFDTIRTHGDYHLGQVLHHGSDFLIIDFEGEPAITLEERRAKQSALRDVAGMIYSFFYAANAVRRDLPGKRSSRLEEANWGRFWSVWAGATFLWAYLQTARSASFIPANETALKAMLDVELLRKAIYELGYELNNRPDWVNIALQVVIDLLNPENPL